MIRRPPRSTQSRSSAASDVYKRQWAPRSCEGRSLAHGRCRRGRMEWRGPGPPGHPPREPGTAPLRTDLRGSRAVSAGQRSRAAVILYLDTSAFAKLVLEEPETAAMRDLFDQADYAVTSVITYPEATSALNRQDRERGPVESRLTGWTAVLDDRWRRCVRLLVAEQLAGRLVVAHGLR